MTRQTAFEIAGGIFDNIVLTIRENPVRAYWFTITLILSIRWLV